MNVRQQVSGRDTRSPREQLLPAAHPIGFAQRLITQMYFEGDPLIRICPIVNTIPDPNATDRLIAPLDMNASVPMDTLAYRFDIVLRGRRSTLFENRPEGN